MKKLIGLLFLANLANASTSIERIIEKSEPKVVKIGIVTTHGGGVCSGAFVNSQGLVLTCAHCFENKKITKVFIKTDKGEVVPAELVSIDAKKDLALIEPIFPYNNTPYFKIGELPHQGQQVVALGSPLGIQGIATVGWVDKVDDEIIFHSAFVNPGNSGGPLINLKGELIGVNHAMLWSGFLQLAHGIYVAINSVVVKAFLVQTGH